MPKQPSLALSCMFLLTLSLAAQQVEEEYPNLNADLAIGEFFLNRAAPSFFEKNSSGAIMLFLTSGTNDPVITKIREELGITEEHRTHVNEFMEAAQPENWEETETIFDSMFHNFYKNSKYTPTEVELASFDSLRDYLFETTNACAAEVFLPNKSKRRTL